MSHVRKWERVQEERSRRVCVMKINISFIFYEKNHCNYM
jgi:hypothetical protein